MRLIAKAFSLADNYAQIERRPVERFRYRPNASAYARAKIVADIFRIYRAATYGEIGFGGVNVDPIVRELRPPTNGAIRRISKRAALRRKRRRPVAMKRRYPGQ